MIEAAAILASLGLGYFTCFIRYRRRLLGMIETKPKQPRLTKNEKIVLDWLSCMQGPSTEEKIWVRCNCMMRSAVVKSVMGLHRKGRVTKNDQGQFSLVEGK